MRLAELSQRAGVPRSTIKFYLREGLLPGGAASAKNQASYGSQHVERLALIRALREVAELPLDAVAKVTAELDRGWKGDPIGEAMRAMHTLPSRGLGPGDAGELRRLTAEVREFMRGLPWTVDEGEGHYFADEIAAALLLVRRHLYPNYTVADLGRHAEIAWLLSEEEFALAPGGPRVPRQARGDDVAEPSRRAILGSVLFERIFAALRRSANAMRSIRLATGARVPAAKRVRRKRGR
jgi:DNA-binding transcriptional MerR regulator